jgi:hypothetical protein
MLYLTEDELTMSLDELKLIALKQSRLRAIRRFNKESNIRRFMDHIRCQKLASQY